MIPANPIWQALLRVLTPKQVCWLCLFATVSLGGYALNVFAKNNDVTEIKEQLLQKEILDMKIEQCKALKAGQPARFYSLRITEQTDKYEKLTGRSPKLPKCEEI